LFVLLGSRLPTFVFLCGILGVIVCIVGIKVTSLCFSVWYIRGDCLYCWDQGYQPLFFLCGILGVIVCIVGINVTNLCFSVWYIRGDCLYCWDQCYQPLFFLCGILGVIVCMLGSWLPTFVFLCGILGVIVCIVGIMVTNLCFSVWYIRGDCLYCWDQCYQPLFFCVVY
jgi:hypothetical protein